MREAEIRMWNDEKNAVAVGRWEMGNKGFGST